MLRFTSLASGSSGNATLIEGRRRDDERPTRVLVDCGLGPRKLAAALAMRGVAAAELDAVFVTHEHSDHVGGVLRLQRRWSVAVWASAGTWQAATDGREPACAACVARDGEPIAIGAVVLRPFAVPHDAAEPLQLVCDQGDCRLGILTDIGAPTADTVRALQGCDALLIVTEWSYFKNPDFDRMKNLLKAPVIFDGRNIFSTDLVKMLGFDYDSIGRAPVLAHSQARATRLKAAV